MIEQDAAKAAEESDCGFEWRCEICGRMTRDNYQIAPGWMNCACIACRGFNTITTAEAQARHRAQEDAWERRRR